MKYPIAWKIIWSPVNSHLNLIFILCLYFFLQSSWVRTNICKRCTGRSRVMFCGSYFVWDAGSIVISLPSTGLLDPIDRTRLDDWATGLNKVLSDSGEACQVGDLGLLWTDCMMHLRTAIDFCLKLYKIERKVQGFSYLFEPWARGPWFRGKIACKFYQIGKIGSEKM